MSLDKVMLEESGLPHRQQPPQGFFQRLKYNFKNLSDLTRAQNAKLTEEQARDTQKICLTNGLMFTGLAAILSNSSSLVAGLMTVSAGLSFYQVGRFSSSILCGAHRKATPEELNNHYRKTRRTHAGLGVIFSAMPLASAWTTQQLYNNILKRPVPWEKYAPMLLLFGGISLLQYYLAYCAHRELNKLENKI